MQDKSQTVNSNFILSPLSDILQEAVTACRGIGNGMETFPMRDYILQTTFMKITRASEQKLKCICWDIATYDYNSRYKLLSDKLGECSSFKEKSDVFSNLLAALLRANPHGRHDILFDSATKHNILSETHSGITHTLENTQFHTWDSRAFHNFRSMPSPFNETMFACPKRNAQTPFTLAEGRLKDFYETVVYRHRNRCAHNLLSYQHNLPAMRTLADKDCEQSHFFNMLHCLFILDAVFIHAYSAFLAQAKKAVL